MDLNMHIYNLKSWKEIGINNFNTSRDFQVGYKCKAFGLKDDPAKFKRFMEVLLKDIRDIEAG